MRILICTLVACALLGSAYAELQNVQVYGRIDIRARYYKSSFNNASVLGGGPALETRIPAMFLPGRATGQAAGVAGVFDYDDARSDWTFTELVTTLGVKADFTNNVNGVIEFYDFAWWGEDFRSDYITGADGRANGESLHQARQGGGERLYSGPVAGFLPGEREAPRPLHMADHGQRAACWMGEQPLRQLGQERTRGNRLPSLG